MFRDIDRQRLDHTLHGPSPAVENGPGLPILDGVAPDDGKVGQRRLGEPRGPAVAPQIRACYCERRVEPHDENLLIRVNGSLFRRMDVGGKSGRMDG